MPAPKRRFSRRWSWLVLTFAAQGCNGGVPTGPESSSTPVVASAARPWSSPIPFDITSPKPYRWAGRNRADGVPILPRVAWVSSDVAIASWSDYYVGILSATYVRARGWSAVDYVVRPPAPPARENCGFCTPVEPFVDIGVRDSGEAVAVWHEAGRSVPGIWSAAFAIESGWGRVGHIADTHLGERLGPDIETAGEHTVIAWGTASETWAAYARGRETEVTRLDTAADRTWIAPAAAVDVKGNAVVVWGRRGGGVRARWRRSGSEEWDPPQDLAPVPGDGWCPTVVLDANGGAVAGFAVLGGQGSASWAGAARLDPQRGWQSVERLAAGAEGCPALAASSPGVVIAAWQGPDGLWAQGFPATGSRQRVSRGHAFPESLAANTHGEAIVAWRDSGNTGRAWAARRDRNGRWTAAEPLQTPDAETAALATAVDVDINERGDTLAFWFEQTGPDGARLTPWARVTQ